MREGKGMVFFSVYGKRGRGKCLFLCTNGGRRRGRSLCMFVPQAVEDRGGGEVEDISVAVGKGEICFYFLVKGEKGKDVCPSAYLSAFHKQMYSIQKGLSVERKVH